MVQIDLEQKTRWPKKNKKRAGKKNDKFYYSPMPITTYHT